MTWPSYFPEDCPPSDTEPTNGPVYRFIQDNPPADADFVCHALLLPERNWGLHRCKACGLSVYKTIDGCEQARRVVPALKKKRVAIGNLTPAHGQLGATPSAKNPHHHTWWVPTSVLKPCELFTVVAP